MSGTSLDGLDLAACRFRPYPGRWHFRMEAAATLPYPAEWADALQDAPQLDGLQLLRLHKAYGRYLGQQAQAFCREAGLRPDLISSHGHTIFHEPHNGLSFQLGDGAVLSATAALPAITDFRAMDVAHGGQGAPLAPIGDQLLFQEFGFCLNLGGIANISYQSGDRRLAFDISPCNLLLNRLARLKGLTYDAGGRLAAGGAVDETLLAKLDAWPYYGQPAPKSLDKESLLTELWPVLEQANLSVEDALATVIRHTARQIGHSVQVALKAGVNPGAGLLATGGGAHNTFLVQEIQRVCPIPIVVPDTRLIDFKEAVVFAFLGLLRLLNRPNGLRSVTGAASDTVGGALYGNFSGLLPQEYPYL